MLLRHKPRSFYENGINRCSRFRVLWRSVPSIYFDCVFDRLRHLNQLKVFYWNASHRTELFDPADPVEHELHHRPEAPTFDFNRQLEIRAAGLLSAATANVKRDYLLWDLALPNLAAGPQHHGAGQTGNRRPVAASWHRKGFGLYWRRRSRHLGRPRMSREIRELIRKMSLANPLWGAPRIHGELLKLGIDVSQTTVGRYLPWRPKVPSRPGARSCTITCMTPPPSTCSLS